MICWLAMDEHQIHDDTTMKRSTIWLGPFLDFRSSVLGTATLHLSDAGRETPAGAGDSET